MFEQGLKEAAVHDEEARQEAREPEREHRRPEPWRLGLRLLGKSVGARLGTAVLGNSGEGGGGAWPRSGGAGAGQRWPEKRSAAATLAIGESPGIAI